MTIPGRLYAGTSGFAYPDWAPLFYPPGIRSTELLAAYGLRLCACELNATYYRRPSASAIRRWVEATPDGFRFAVKAQRGAARRAMTGDAAESIRWLTEPLGAFGDRLGAVLVRAETSVARDDDRLDALLRAWPAGLPLCLELQHTTWLDDGVQARLRDAGAALCATDVDEAPEPDLRALGPFLYVRLRRASYDDEAITRWARRLSPFLADGRDAFVFFRHDERGESALRAEALAAAVSRIGTSEGIGHPPPP